MDCPIWIRIKNIEMCVWKMVFFYRATDYLQKPNGNLQPMVWSGTPIRNLLPKEKFIHGMDTTCVMVITTAVTMVSLLPTLFADEVTIWVLPALLMIMLI